MGKQPIPQDWDNVTYCCHVIEWPDSQQWRAVLSGLLTMPLRGRFWDGNTGSITDTQGIGREIENRNCLFKSEGSMTCLDDIIVQLTILANAASSGGGSDCKGTGGSGLFAEPESAFVDDGETTVPTGYTDRAEYEATKCNLAQYVLERIASDLQNIRTLDIIGLAVSAVVGLLGFTLLTPIPFDDIIGIGAALVTIVTLLGTTTALIQEAIDYVTALDICLLYEAQDVATAITDVHADIDSQTFTVNDALTKELLKKWFNVDSLNILFEPKPALQNLPTGDCSSCNPEECCYTITTGSGPAYPGGTSFVSVKPGANHVVSIAQWDACPSCPDQQVTIHSVSGWTGSTQVVTRSHRDLTGTPVNINFNPVTSPPFSFNMQADTLTLTASSTQSGPVTYHITFANIPP